MYMNDKRALIVDNVIGTTEALNDLEFIVEKAGGINATKVAVFADSDVINNGDIIYITHIN